MLQIQKKPFPTVGELLKSKDFFDYVEIRKTKEMSFNVLDTEVVDVVRAEYGAVTYPKNHDFDYEQKVFASSEWSDDNVRSGLVIILVPETLSVKSRPEITKFLSLSLEKHLNPKNDSRIYWAREVTFDSGSVNAVRIDYMLFKPVNNSVSGIEKGDFYCFEIKSSVDDFHSKNGHNFIGEYNYYVMPADVYAAISEEIPYGVGVFVPDGMEEDGTYCRLLNIRKAKKRDRQRPISEMLLMMFRSAARDGKKS